MRLITLATAQEELQRIADQVGTKSFVKAKALYLQGVAITDETGAPLSVDDLDVVIAPAAGSTTEDAEDEPMDEEGEKAVDDVVSAVAPKAAKIDRRKALGGIAIKTSGNAFAPRRKTYGRLRNFRDGGDFDAVEKAYRFGRTFAAMAGSRKSLDWCERNGIQLKTHTESSNPAGGYLVPEEFENDLIMLREEYGVFRPSARVLPMAADTKRIPRWKSGLTAQWVGETSAITESTSVFESVTLVAKKMGATAVVSNELNEDAMVSIGDYVAGEIGKAFALKEDQAGFIGDGTSTHVGIQGVAYILQNGTSGKQYFDANLTAFADLTIDDIHTTMSLLPQYADSQNCAWYMHKTVWHGMFEPVLSALGGTTVSEVQAGYGRTPMLLGYPVRYTQVMPSAIAADTAMAVFGDLSLAATLGDRSETSIVVDASATVGGVSMFETDSLAVRGTQRLDINVHDTGDATTTGPVVALRA